MTDVETVARALCKADGHNPNGWAEGRDGVWIQRDWRAYRKLARAALAAATPLIEARVREEVLGVIYDIRGLVIEADDLERITHVEALHQIDTLASKALVDAVKSKPRSKTHDPNSFGSLRRNRRTVV